MYHTPYTVACVFLRHVLQAAPINVTPLRITYGRIHNAYLRVTKYESDVVPSPGAATPTPCRLHPLPRPRLAQSPP